MLGGETELHTKKNAGGRPTERGESKRAPISMRTTPTLRAALEDAAGRGGRSLAQEIEQRLERSLEDEQRLGGPQTSALIAAILADIAAVEEITGARWYEDIKTYGAVRHAVREQIADRMPIPRKEVLAASSNLSAVDAVIRFSASITAGLLPRPEGWDSRNATSIIDNEMAAVKDLFDRYDALAKEGEAIYDEIRERQDLIASRRKHRRGA